MAGSEKRKVTPYKDFYGHDKPKKPNDNSNYETGISNYEY
jgi:hypothetical protein